MCEEASRLLGLYTAALSEFHDSQAPLLRGVSPNSREFAGTMQAKEAAHAVLQQTRRCYWDHVRVHGCRESPAEPEEKRALPSQGKSDRLWRRVQDAKRELDLAHDAVHEAQHELKSGALPAPDGNYAYKQTLKTQEQALSLYCAALGEWKVMLQAEPAGHDQKTEADRGGSVAARRQAVLTRRELEVLTHIASGKSSREIANLLGIAFKTVVVHRHHIQTKLKVHNTADLTRTALRMGLIEP